MARLATVNPDGTAHVVPIVFANDPKSIFFALDKKHKKTRNAKLRRILNIERTGKATMLIDGYSDDWEKLWFSLIYANARVLHPLSAQNFNEKRKALRLLRRKYAQYKVGGYLPFDERSATIVKLSPYRIVSWPQNLRGPQGKYREILVKTRLRRKNCRRQLLLAKRTRIPRL